jgi:hypothetical protein
MSLSTLQPDEYQAFLARLNNVDEALKVYIHHYTNRETEILNASINIEVIRNLLPAKLLTVCEKLLIMWSRVCSRKSGILR